MSVILALPLLASCLVGPPDGHKTSLFDGKTLNGWQVRGCEIEVSEGSILIKAGNGLLRSNARYGDFILDLEWKALKGDKWDSGIYFRCELPQGKKPWPRMYQAILITRKDTV